MSLKESYSNMSELNNNNSQEHDDNTLHHKLNLNDKPLLIKRKFDESSFQKEERLKAAALAQRMRRKLETKEQSRLRLLKDGIRRKKRIENESIQERELRLEKVREKCRRWRLKNKIFKTFDIPKHLTELVTILINKSKPFVNLDYIKGKNFKEILLIFDEQFNQFELFSISLLNTIDGIIKEVKPKRCLKERGVKLIEKVQNLDEFIYLTKSRTNRMSSNQHCTPVLNSPLELEFEDPIYIKK